MRQALIWLLVFANCAPVAAPASNPVLAAPTSAPAPGPVVLDEQGVRELLQGVELELGDCRADAAAQHVRADNAQEFAEAAQKVAKQNALWAQFGPAIGGTLGGVAGLALGVLIGFFVAGASR